MTRNKSHFKLHGHEVIEFGQKLTFWLKNQPFLPRKGYLLIKTLIQAEKNFVFRPKLA